jgi:7,8-dihydropterin-6-yl-methyl-4-(beta-D-ribofuranosyl)aminobenzene 5'-phosphate synthase
VSDKSSIIEELKEAIKKFGDKDVEETMQKILNGQKLSEEELEEAFYDILPWLSLSLLNNKYKENKRITEEEWNNYLNEKIDANEWESIEKLEILPLIDAKTDNPSLKTEHGVSYFIKADDTTILFDLGMNKKDEHPSPLLQNMEKLGVKIEDVDYVFLSHAHHDHTGGEKWVRDNTFGISGKQQDLSHLTVFTPIKMEHPSAKIQYIPKPHIIGKGIASIGTISQPMFFWGIAIEQSLMINVKEKGLVIIVGCGHQGVRAIVERAENIVDKQVPIYGFIGGMHLPIPKFPDAKEWMGIPYHEFVGTRRPIWQPWSVNDVYAAIDSLKIRNVKLVSVSAHDSSDESIETFRSKFDQYIDLRVGKSIII